MKPFGTTEYAEYTERKDLREKALFKCLSFREVLTLYRPFFAKCGGLDKACDKVEGEVSGLRGSGRMGSGLKRDSKTPLIFSLSVYSAYSVVPHR